MPNDEPPIVPDPGAAGTPPDPWGSPIGKLMKTYGLAVGVVVVLLSMGSRVYSIATRRHPEAQASEADVSCSSYTAVQLVGDIIKEHVFAGEAKDMLNPDQFGGKLVDVAVVSSKPLVCSASFVPRLALSKAALDDAARSGTTKAALDEIHANAVDKYSAALKYKVRDNGSGKVYVTITDGLDAFDDCPRTDSPSSTTSDVQGGRPSHARSARDDAHALGRSIEVCGARAHSSVTVLAVDRTKIPAAA